MRYPILLLDADGTLLDFDQAEDQALRLGSNHYNVGVGSLLIIVGTTYNSGVEAQQLSSLHHIHCLTF